ncbi:uncharacterized protein BCR38DRAFT_445362 [Pseudomassariella vexata]|uniref:18S rRNA factor 2 n=1 Tax=Pseudomassariella vexata TaxID=1141098 RepID=A0A1Y2DKS8_9PEZI|nr:uncharacterized protein BCR38DRAFT_445362 [Pseudomassariella vexata]ORY59736.1 hypothetical protein BCR38DRAFT_445362 [Pseudomassariella vexata]
MPAEKRNAFLDVDDSEDDNGSYESETELQKGGRSSKRQRLEQDDISDGDGFEDLSEEEEDSKEADTEIEEKVKPKNGNPNDKSSVEDAPTELPGVSKPLTKKNLVATEAAVKKSGVVYLSRIPPFMKPQKLRSLLEPYGTINRIFLTPEDPKAHSQRVHNGGNKKRSYTDGWVEFVNKRDAKKAVDLLNARTIGGKKGTFYRDDIWNLLYLKGFKWNDLTAQISAEAAEKMSRMRAEISKTNKENKDFVRNVEKAKMLDGIQSKAAAKKKNKGGNVSSQTKSLRQFEQSAVAKKGIEQLPEDAERVSRMLFA